MTEPLENIILITFDALRADHLGCYGYKRDTSPKIDRFARECLRFTNAFSVSSHTREAVPALLTGEYPDVSIDSKYHLASDTIAQRLSDRGYSTAGFHSNPFVSRAYGFDPGFDLFDDDLHLGQHKLFALAQRALDKLRNRHYARAKEINERSLEWIDSLDSRQSFFLWNHYMDTHGPYEPLNEYSMLYTERDLSNRDAQSLYQRATSDPDSITDDERQTLVELYDCEIRYNDEQIGRFLDELRKRGLFDKSLVIVTADHGDAFGEHGYFGHPRYLHDELVHVPMLVRPPGGANAKVDAPVSTLDIVATIENANTSADSTSLLSSIAEDRRVFSQARGENEHNHLRRYAIRTKEETCICEHNTKSGKIEITASTDQSLCIELKRHVEDRERTDFVNNSNDENMDEEIERRLSALGYKE